MRSENTALAGGAHDVVERGSQLKDFKSRLSKIAVPPDISVTEPQNVPEFMRECPHRDISGTQRDVTSHKTMGRFRTGRQHCAIFRKA